MHKRASAAAFRRVTERVAIPVGPVGCEQRCPTTVTVRPDRLRDWKDHVCWLFSSDEGTKQFDGFAVLREVIPFFRLE